MMTQQAQHESIIVKQDVSLQQEHIQLKQYGYRLIIVLLFSMLTFVNGACWVVVTPIATTIAKAYDVSEPVVTLIPMSYLIWYVFVNFPSNWVLDEKGIKKGVVAGAVLTALGAGIRCAANASFYYVLVGQCFCAIAQPFITNAPTKVAARWFLPQSRSLALAVLIVMNIIGVSVGFLVSPMFVDANQTAEKIRDDFKILLIVQFCLAFIAMLCIIIFFKERPPTLPSYGAMVATEKSSKAVKTLFSSGKFLLLNFAFATVNGAFNIYGSLIQNILHPFGYTDDQVSLMATFMTAIGILSALLIGIFVEKTLKYSLAFKVLAAIGILDTLGFSLCLIFKVELWLIMLVVIMMGVIFVPMMPLCFDYGCEVMFPIGEAQITGAMMTSGQILGILYILISQHVFKLDDKNKVAAKNTSYLVGAFSLVGGIIFFFMNSKLKRSDLEKMKKQESLLSEHR